MLKIKSKKPTLSSLKGFTLIELLVVIAIIGILSSVVLVRVSSQKTKAQSASFKATVSSLQPALIMCCNSGGAALAVAGGDICNPAISSILPSAISGITVTSYSLGATTCALDNATLTVTASVGDCTSGTVSEYGITFSGC